jgi:protein ImuB
MAYISLHVPDFLVQAALRSTSKGSYLRDAVVVVDGHESLMRVVSSNLAACQQGITPGMPKAALAVFPDLLICRRSHESEVSAHSALMDFAFGFTPRVEGTGPGSVLMDVRGGQRLFGKPQEMLKAISGQLHSTGMFVHLASGSTPDAAICVARGLPGPTVVQPGDEARQLAPLPLSTLQPAPELLDKLQCCGIKTCGELAQLPVIAVKQRFGQEGLQLLRLAKGQVDRELVPSPEPFRFQEVLELEEPIEFLEPLCEAMHRIVGLLVDRLASRALATDEISFSFQLETRQDRQLGADQQFENCEPKATYENRLKIPVPSQNADLLMDLIHLQLQSAPPSGAIKKICIEALAAKVRAAQGGLFEPAAPHPVRLELTVTRIHGVVGETDSQGRGRVGFPSLHDTYQPDNFTIVSQSEWARPLTFVAPAQPAFLRLRPALSIRVLKENCLIREVIFASGRHRAARCWGPWKTCGSWWNSAAEWDREEWDVELECPTGPTFYRIFRNLRTHEWFLEGVYD